MIDFAKIIEDEKREFQEHWDQYEPGIIKVDHPVMTPDCRCIMHRDWADLWVVIGDYGDGMMTVELDYQTDALTPLLDYMWSAETPTEWLFPGVRFDDEMAKEMLEMGVAPGQPFRIWMKLTASKYETVDGTEYDEGLDWKLLEVAPLEPEEAARRWEEWMKTWEEE